MAVIRLGERRPVAAPRRVRLGLPGLSALDRALVESGDLRLPPDLVPEPSPTVAALAGVDLDLLLAEAGIALHGHGVLDDHGVTPAVAANVAGLVAAPRRVRISLAGTGLDLLGYHWVDAAVGGSLVRDRAEAVLSLYDARSIGTELLAALPDPGPNQGELPAGRGPAGGAEHAARRRGRPGPAPRARRTARGRRRRRTPAARVERKRPGRPARHRPPERARPAARDARVVPRPARLVGARTHRGDDGRLRVRLEPCERHDLVPRLATLIEGAWA